MRLLIVIVNYRSAELTLDCLRSLEPEVVRIDGCRVVVVENASGESGTLAAAIESNGWNHWCSLMDLLTNRGFAAGNNAAIEPALSANDIPEYVLLLNPDTRVCGNAIEELFGFGRWVFFSTVCGFIVAQSDRIILGLFLTTASLGVYNIGVGLATVPWTISTMLSGRILFPIYTMRPPLKSMENRRFIKRLRAGFGLGMIGLSVPLMFFGPFLVSQLYDQRYLAAGGIVTLFSIALLPESILLNSDQVLLAAGDSKRYLIVKLASAVLQITLTLAGVVWGGCGGVALGFFLSRLIVYFVLDWAIQKHGARAGKLDFGLLGLSLGLSAFECWMNAAAVTQCFVPGTIR